MLRKLVLSALIVALGGGVASAGALSHVRPFQFGEQPLGLVTVTQNGVTVATNTSRRTELVFASEDGRAADRPLGQIAAGGTEQFVLADGARVTWVAAAA